MTAFGLEFPNPIGLAAGFDKDAEVPDAMLKFGFGFVECGSITPRPQAGNPRPRLFRLASDRAVINRMGFNNGGMDRAAARLAKRARNGILGINIGANKDSADRIADYRLAFQRLAPFADYIASMFLRPTRRDCAGCRTRTNSNACSAFSPKRARRSGSHCHCCSRSRPTSTTRRWTTSRSAALTCGIEGLIVGNTTIARPASLISAHAAETGGFSGAPLFDLSTARVARDAMRAWARNWCWSGVGGVSSGEEAYAKIRAGASLVQLYTALAFHGPGLIPKIKRDLHALLISDGFDTVAQAVGADSR